VIALLRLVRVWESVFSGSPLSRRAPVPLLALESPD